MPRKEVFLSYPLTPAPITNKARLLRIAKPFQQFGQANDAYTANGATGCTHTVLQFLALLWTNRWYTHDQISQMVGYPNQSRVAISQRRGLRPEEVKTFIAKAKLPYAVVFNWDLAKIIAASTLGPVGIAHAYSWVPEWMGFRISGLVSDGKPNGFASPHGRAGKTQLVGFTGAHMGCFIGRGLDPTGKISLRLFWEPNHASPARPEKPPYDVISPVQFAAVYDSYKSVLNRDLYALVPTRALPV